ncbi:hypothetical protein BDK51DRAFT_48095 [Blyttiomyces helicus]|uniref:Uncharacterized protein n=1 Tax=Blyttiomyces helicus TaxID=388810 RepID=A0A4P9W3I2_9FUNG|nr:hypothetical protein BDK51DRAFT_48095 [Blyttiomyces helicus]|eukprot:RKO85348.1 hypothetical protein BDK51DRAFT_48095 [Blyttiomyces helicus]
MTLLAKLLLLLLNCFVSAVTYNPLKPALWGFACLGGNDDYDMDDDYDAMDVDSHPTVVAPQPPLLAAPSNGILIDLPRPLSELPRLDMDLPGVSSLPRLQPGATLEVVPIDRRQLAHYFPGFEEGKVQFSQWFMRKVAPKPKQLKKPKKVLFRDQQFYEVLADEGDLFRGDEMSSLTARQRESLMVHENKEAPVSLTAIRQKVEADVLKDIDPQAFRPVIIDEWEARIIWDEPPPLLTLPVDVDPSNLRYKQLTTDHSTTSQMLREVRAKDVDGFAQEELTGCLVLPESANDISLEIRPSRPVTGSTRSSGTTPFHSPQSISTFPTWLCCVDVRRGR